MKKITNPILALFVLTIGTVSAQCTFSGLSPNYCVNSPTSALTTTTTGGTFVGPGVINSVFSPSLAGPGTHTITYAVCSTSYAISTGSYMPLTTSGTGVSLTDDQVSSSLPIGFNFKFFCNTYSNFYICSNGFLTFAAGQPAVYPGQTMPDATTPNDIIAGVWCDLNPTSGGTITYTTLGTQPNRTLVVSYNGVPYYGPAAPVTFQIHLKESTDIIEIHSTSVPTNTANSSSYRTMGIENSGGTAAFVVTGRNASTFTATNECMRFTPGVSCSASQTTIVSPSTITVVGNNSVCVGTTSTLTATGNNTYTWSTSSGTFANTSSITTTPSTSTTYSVSGTNSFGCIANSAITVTVDNTPTVTAVSSSTGNGVCPSNTLILSGSGATSYTWTGGITNGVPFTIPTSTNFVVTGANACGSNTAAISVSIHPNPNVTATASTPSLCSGQTATLTGGGASTYTWSNGVPNGVSFAPVVSNNYTVTGTSALGCTAQAVTNISVVTTPILAPVASPTLICIGKTSTLSVSGASNYSWSTTQTTSSIVVSPTTTSTYTITKWNANCYDTKTITVIVNALPIVFAIGSPTLICAMECATLNAGGGATYSWTPFGGNGSQAVVCPAASTDFTVAASDGTCVNTAIIPISVNPLPTVNIVTSSSVICNKDTAYISVSGTHSYSWTNPPSLGTATSVAVTPTAPVLYQVTGTNTLTGCSSQTSQIVLVNPLPTMTVAATKTLVCINGPSTLTVKGSASSYTYSWSSGPTTSATIVNPQNTTTYSVLATNTITTCKSTSMVTVNVFQPTFAVNSPTSSCLGGTITLMASGANSYTWNGTSPFQSIQVSPSTATFYVVAATSTLSGVSCVSQNTVQVSIYANPTITAMPERTLVCKGETVNLIAGGGATYTWNTQQVGDTVNVKPTAQTNYTVYGTDQNGCKSTATLQVKYSNCVGIDEASANSMVLLIYPNPNNGEFVITSQSNIELSLINELGQLIRKISLTDENERKVSVTGIANGIYFIRGSNGTAFINEKIIITK